MRAVRGLSSLKERSITTGNIYVSIHPPARTSHSQTGIPGASRSQALAGGLRAAAAVHVQRAVPSALVPASTAMPGLVGLSSADLGVLASQHMFAYMQAQIAGAAGGVSGASPSVQGSAQDSMFFLQATLIRARSDTVAFEHTQLM